MSNGNLTSKSLGRRGEGGGAKRISL